MKFSTNSRFRFYIVLDDIFIDSEVETFLKKVKIVPNQESIQWTISTRPFF